MEPDVTGAGSTPCGCAANIGALAIISTTQKILNIPDRITTQCFVYLVLTNSPCGISVLLPFSAGGRRRTVTGCQLIPAREKSWNTACSQLRALDPDSVASISYSISLPGLLIWSNAKCIVTFAWSYGMRMGPAWRRKR